MADIGIRFTQNDGASVDPTKQINDAGPGVGIEAGFDLNLYHNQFPVHLTLAADYINSEYSSDTAPIECRDKSRSDCIKAIGIGTSHIFRTNLSISPTFNWNILYLRPYIGPVLRVHHDKLNNPGTAGFQGTETVLGVTYGFSVGVKFYDSLGFWLSTFNDHISDDAIGRDNGLI